MKYTMNFGPWSTVFAVPSQIVDDHMRMCGAAQLKVLLLLLRHANDPMELCELAAVLNISPGDTQDALNYWITAGVLVAQPTEDGAELTASLPKAHARADTAKLPPATANTVDEPVVEHTQPPAVVAFPEKETHISPEQVQEPAEPKPPRVRLSPAEITEMAERSGELKSLLSETEASLGKTLSSADISTLASLYDWAGIPVDVLLTVMEYCKQKGKTNLRYVEKVALGWQEKGIDTFEKAERYIKQTLESDAQENLCKSAFGIYDRRLSSKETEFVKSWFNDYKFDIAIIKLAYERSVEHTGKVSFPYINKILTNWHEQHIKTPEEATKEEKAFSRKRDENNKPKSSYDIDEFEEYLLRNAQNG